MKNFSLICLLLCVISCTGVSAQSAKSPEVEALIDKTLKQMIFVEGGSFMMGDPRQPFADALGKDAWTQYFTSERNVPVHKVTLDSYYMGAYEVTYEDYDVYTKALGQELILKKYLTRSGNVRDPQNPVGISWNGACNYCQWLSEQSRLPFSLPTEAQWEYAARNRGGIVVFATDNGKAERGRNFPPESLDFPKNVGRFPPNPMGFYDLSGNADEWVNDWYQEDYYSYSPEKNPQGPESGTKKVARGGGALSDSTTVARGGARYLNKDLPGMGFRCVINTDKPLPIKK